VKVLRMTTALLASEGGGAYIALDESVREQLGGGGRIPVIARINGVEYRGTACRMGGMFCLGINKKIRVAANIAPGDSVRVALRRDEEPRVVDPSPDFAKALAKNRAARDAFDALSFTHRKEYVRWIESAKRDETRHARIVKAIAMLTEGR
jgi:hypothetical protein